MPGGRLCPANHITITNEKRIDIGPVARFAEPSTGCRNRQKSTVSGNVARKLKSMRGKMAVLCPETDGLQAKHRIKRTLKGKTRKEQEEEILDIVANEVTSFKPITKLTARIVSRVYDFGGFTSEEVNHILEKDYYKNIR